jgi:hypothetical protein
MKKLFATILCIVLLLTCAGCMFFASDMPFNGDITFHEISMTIPTRFIRDSTQSTDALWIFERGNYSEYIILSCKPANGDTTQALPSYVEYMKENGANSQIISFMDNDAVLSEYEMDGVFCQELLFIQNDSYYAIALRGGTEEGFAEITDTIQLIEAEEEA